MNAEFKWTEEILDILEHSKKNFTFLTIESRVLSSTLKGRKKHSFFSFSKYFPNVKD